MRITAKIKDCRLIVRVKGSFGEKFDSRAVDAFALTYLRGFMRPKLVKSNVIEYTGPMGISLYERLKRPITKRDFLFIMEQVAVAVQEICNHKLYLKKLLLDIRYCYINETTKEIQMLYVPVETTFVQHDVNSFIDSIIYRTIPAGGEDADTVSRFVHFIRSMKRFDPDTVEEFIVKEDVSVVNTIKKNIAGQSGFMTSKQKSYYDHYDRKKNDDNDETALIDEDATGLLEDNATGLLSEDATGLLGEDATGLLGEEETGLLADMRSDDGGETCLLNFDEDEGTALLDNSYHVSFPTLCRLATSETISVNKPVFRLGKERSYVDYFVTNNNAVSRSHADIITRSNRYFVIDLNSKNHTYINGQVLAIQCETEIFNGDTLRLGNEDFVFRTDGGAESSACCPRCKAPVKAGALYCYNCGKEL